MRALFHALIATGVFSTLACMVVLFELSTDVTPAFSEQAAVYAVYEIKEHESSLQDAHEPVNENIPRAEIASTSDVENVSLVAQSEAVISEEEERLEESVKEPEVETVFVREDVLVTPTTPIEPESLKTFSDDIARTITNHIHAVTNATREEESLQEYVLDAELGELATARSEEMATLNYFSHTSPRGCDMDCVWKSSGYKAVRWGENIAWYDPYTGLSAEKLAEKFVRDWEQSSGHRKNLLSSEFTHHGVGVAVDGTKLIVTVIFVEPE